MTIEIKILTAPGCKTCDHAKGLVQKIVKQWGQDFPELSCRTIDVVKSPDIGARYGILSTPAIIINDTLAFRGVPSEKALREQLEML